MKSKKALIFTLVIFLLWSLSACQYVPYKITNNGEADGVKVEKTLSLPGEEIVVSCPAAIYDGTLCVYINGKEELKYLYTEGERSYYSFVMPSKNVVITAEVLGGLWGDDISVYEVKYGKNPMKNDFQKVLASYEEYTKFCEDNAQLQLGEKDYNEDFFISNSLILLSRPTGGLYYARLSDLYVGEGDGIKLVFSQPDISHIPDMDMDEFVQNNLPILYEIAVNKRVVPEIKNITTNVGPSGDMLSLRYAYSQGDIRPESLTFVIHNWETKKTYVPTEKEKDGIITSVKDYYFFWEQFGSESEMPDKIDFSLLYDRVQYLGDIDGYIAFYLDLGADTPNKEETIGEYTYKYRSLPLMLWKKSA